MQGIRQLFRLRPELVEGLRRDEPKDTRNQAGC